MRTRQELTKALQETEGPMKVTSECLYKREGRRVSNSVYKIHSHTNYTTTALDFSDSISYLI